MFKTIQIGNYQFVQGLFVKELPDGRVVIQVGDQQYTGLPVERKAA